MRTPMSVRMGVAAPMTTTLTTATATATITITSPAIPPTPDIGGCSGGRC